MLHFSWAKRETQKQNSQDISGKRRDSPGIIPGQSCDYAFSCLFVFSGPKQQYCAQLCSCHLSLQIKFQQFFCWMHWGLLDGDRRLSVSGEIFSLDIVPPSNWLANSFVLLASWQSLIGVTRRIAKPTSNASGQSCEPQGTSSRPDSVQNPMAKLKTLKPMQRTKSCALLFPTAMTVEEKCRAELF